VLNEREPPSPQTHGGGEKLPEQLRALAERTGGIAHDLNNMLGTMIGYGALVLEDLPSDDPNRAFLAKVIEAGAEAKQLVAELLDNARAEMAR
jgi:two-component system cell cycle sensor histidine kinase/response regulator CckA